MTDNQPKPTITFQEQLALLKKRKLIVKDDSFALRYLQRNNYYHLNIYFKQKQWFTGFIDEQGKREIEFDPGTTFEDIVRMHENDCRLRGFIHLLLQPIEIRLRTIISYEMGQMFGSLVFYEDKPYFATNKIQRLRDQFAEVIRLDNGNR
jgi:abortive infection bacteriophage resistance protein